MPLPIGLDVPAFLIGPVSLSGPSQPSERKRLQIRLPGYPVAVSEIQTGSSSSKRKADDVPLPTPYVLDLPDPFYAFVEANGFRLHKPGAKDPKSPRTSRNSRFRRHKVRAWVHTPIN